MKNFLLASALLTMSSCASVPFLAPQAINTPATPVFFQPFSAALDQPALTTISAVATAANQKPNARIYVTGAADSTGSASVNKYLSKTRAQIVADTLAADGVAPSRIHIRAAGIVPAPGPNGSPAQSARRVLIQIAG
jgi:outer membrane protein OmpA-like peptidoglycan-associated protein